MPVRSSVRRAAAVSGLAAALLPLVVYAFSARTAPGFWDLGEMATVPYLLGIAHPTCFPAFVLIGWVVTHAVPFGTIAWRSALVACGGGALAAYAMWLALITLEAPPIVATSFALVFAFGEVVWTRATRPEVHVLELGFETLAIALSLVFHRGGRMRYALGALLSIGFALATHPNALWIALGTVVILATASRRWNVRACALGAAAGAAPLLLYLYIIPRSIWIDHTGADPTRALGVPPGQPFWAYGDPSTIAGFLWMVTGRQWDTHAALAAVFEPARDLQGLQLFTATMILEHGAIVLALAVVGLALMAVRAPRVAAGLLLALVAVSAFASAYSANESDPPRYLLAGLWIGALFAGYAVGIVSRFRVLAPVASLGSMLLVLLTCAPNQSIFEQRGDPGALPFIARVKAETGPSDVIVTQWNYVTPLGYAAYAEHDFGNRIPVNEGVPDGDWLVRRLAESYPTDIILERYIPIPGVTLTPLDRDFPTVYRVTAVHSKR